MSVYTIINNIKITLEEYVNTDNLLYEGCGRYGDRHVLNEKLNKYNANSILYTDGKFRVITDNMDICKHIMDVDEVNIEDIGEKMGFILKANKNSFDELYKLSGYKTAYFTDVITISRAYTSDSIHLSIMGLYSKTLNLSLDMNRNKINACFN